jgi:hypothetical protein
MMSEKIAGELLSEALKTHRRNPESKEAERCRQTVFSVDQQLETLAERLSSLPATISPTPIFKQMEKLEGIKNAAQSKLTQLAQNQDVYCAPVDKKHRGQPGSGICELRDRHELCAAIPTSGVGSSQ